MLTVAALTAALRQLGVAAGDILMVHASLRAIGPVEGGAAGVVEALDAAVRPAGGLLMILSAEDPFAWVNKRPEHMRAKLLLAAPPFDVAATPANADIGVLAEVFRTTPATVVNDHPEARFGARGRAASLIEGAPWNDYYGPGSPLDLLCQAGGKVLRLGANPDTVTALHFAEYLVDLPVKRRDKRYRKVRTGEGEMIRTVECLDDSDGIVDLEGEDYFARILKAFLVEGEARRGFVGAAASELFEARAIVDFGVAWMAQHLRN